MDYNFNEALENNLREGFKPSPREAISEAFSIYKSRAGLFIAYTLLYFIINGIIGQIPVQSLSNILSLIVAGPLMAGFMIAAHWVKEDRGELRFNTFWEGFNLTGKYIQFNILQAVFMVILFIPGIIFIISISGMEFPDTTMEVLRSFGPNIFILAILFLVPAILVGLSYIFAIPFIQFAGEKTWQAMEKSRKLVWRNFGVYLVFVLMLFGVNILGLLCLIVGLFVTIPVSIIASYLMFRQLMMVDSGTDIGEHLVGE